MDQVRQHAPYRAGPVKTLPSAQTRVQHDTIDASDAAFFIAESSRQRTHATQAGQVDELGMEADAGFKGGADAGFLLRGGMRMIDDILGKGGNCGFGLAG